MPQNCHVVWFQILYEYIARSLEFWNISILLFDWFIQDFYPQGGQNYTRNEFQYKLHQSEIAIGKFFAIVTLKKK